MQYKLLAQSTEEGIYPGPEEPEPTFASVKAIRKRDTRLPLGQSAWDSISARFSETAAHRTPSVLPVCPGRPETHSSLDPKEGKLKHLFFPLS